MSKPARYVVEPGVTGFVLRDIGGEMGWQVLAVLQSEAAAQTAAQALNRGVSETVAGQGRWEDAP